MDLVISDLLIPIEHDGMAAYAAAAARVLELTAGEISISKLLSKSLEARNQEQFYYKLTLVVRISADYANTPGFPLYQEFRPIPRQLTTRRERPIVVGFGPAGMFAALELVEYGHKPLIFERGKRIEERSLDVQRFLAEREINPESNIQFGEGGAGSFSDGKLFSRRHLNSRHTTRVLETLIKFGAPPEIAYIAKPHLGTDVLCVIVRNIRNHILERGGEIHYGARMTNLLLSEGAAAGIVINEEREYLSSSIYLALGHSARETLALLHGKGVAMEQKPIAVGVRIEHPAETINRLRYGNKYQDFPGLGAATYSLNHTNKKIHRGVYTFCMCPGGEVINASSAPGLLVLNGMSYSRRASPFSNAGLVVNCQVEDYQRPAPLAGLEFQKEIEAKAFKAGGENWQVPAQNLPDFLGETSSPNLNENSYAMGAVSADLREIFPDFVIAELVAAFTKWRAEVPLFVSHQAILLGAETRTSSPVKIIRDERYESVNTKNLFPIGEGSGYTGGITSSAADAIRAVEIQAAQG
ncbi:MAG: dehydrogenase [Desulfobulbaceae bacterium]|nr:dehydrogenase [Desulfobulbaceae bacterium]